MAGRGGGQGSYGSVGSQGHGASGQAPFHGAGGKFQGLLGSSGDFLQGRAVRPEVPQFFQAHAVPEIHVLDPPEFLHKGLQGTGKDVHFGLPQLPDGGSGLFPGFFPFFFRPLGPPFVPMGHVLGIIHFADGGNGLLHSLAPDHQGSSS